MTFIFLKKESNIHTKDTDKNTNINISFTSGPGVKSVHMNMASIMVFFVWYLYEMHTARHSQVRTKITENGERTKAEFVTVCSMYLYMGSQWRNVLGPIG